jgi:itaconyl-CoA hydratase
MSDQDVRQAPKEWRGRFFEDFDVGDVFKSRLGRTMTEVDNIWFTGITFNTNQMHFNTAYSETTRFGKPLMNSCLTLGVICGLSVPDTSENGTANLAWTDIKIPNPVFAGDTLYAESEVLSLRESASKPNVGIVGLRTRGINQDGKVVMEFLRTFMCYRRDAPEVQDTFPETSAKWGVG